VEKEDPKLKKGERVKTQSEAPGYKVQAIREVLDDGEMIDRWEFWSEYSPQRETWLIGPGTPRKFDENGEEINPTATTPAG
jgi:hypothetical protein